MVGFFGQIKKIVNNKTPRCIDIYAPMSGLIEPIESTPDLVFAEKVVGDGVTIKPSTGEVLAPIDGVVSRIFDTKHAFTITSKEGIKVAVHIGIDTIDLKSEGFEAKVTEGAKVKKGDLIIQVDLPFITEKAKSILSPIVIANMDAVKKIDKRHGQVEAGKDILMTITI